MKKKEIEKLQEREKQLYAQFQASLGDNNKFADYLTKVFKKKIKRAKKKVTDGEGIVILYHRLHENIVLPTESRDCYV
jgi:predicted SnoaL-like aldol condensation-catalyzing enzyme